MLLDGATGATLWSRSADVPLPMASTTKIMTALVVLESKGLNLNRVVTVQPAYPRYAQDLDASSAGLVAGDRLSVRQLLYGMLLPSGCDAAFALADTFGTGSTTGARVADFVVRMNAKARDLDLDRTRFAGFDGNAPATENYTTPRSLAALTRYALRNATFAALVQTRITRQAAVTASGRLRTYTFRTTNLLLGSYAGAIGVKTGTSTVAGPCLVFAAKRGGRYVVGVVLSSSSDTARYVDARRMLDWAFA